MFAIIEDGSRQYRVEQGETLQLDYCKDAEPGDTLSFEKVLLACGGASSVIGRPHIEGAVVEAEVVEPLVKDKKIEVHKIRRRKNSRTHTGHRQKYTSVRITSINVPGLEIAEPPAEPEAQPTTASSPQEPPRPAPGQGVSPAARESE